MTVANPTPGGRFFLSILVLALIVGSAVAAPRLLSLDDLGSDRQNELWEKIDDYAGYAVMVDRCASGYGFEREFAAAVRACVEPASIATVRQKFRERYQIIAHRMRPDACSDAYVVQSKLPERVKTVLVSTVAKVRRLCDNYARTGIILPF